MKDPRTGLAQLCDLLNSEGARYLVVGAISMQLWGTTRATRDIDILIDPEPENAERVLRARGDTPNVNILRRASKLEWSDAERGLKVEEKQS